MKESELSIVLEELAPKSARGKYLIGAFLDYDCLQRNAKGEFSGASACGGVSEDYERLNVTKWGNTDEYTSADIKYYRPGCKNKRPDRQTTNP